MCGRWQRSSSERPPPSAPSGEAPGPAGTWNVLPEVDLWGDNFVGRSKHGLQPLQIQHCQNSKVLIWRKMICIKKERKPRLHDNLNYFNQRAVFHSVESSGRNPIKGRERESGKCWITFHLTGKRLKLRQIFDQMVVYCWLVLRGLCPGKIETFLYFATEYLARENYEQIESLLVMTWSFET